MIRPARALLPPVLALLLLAAAPAHATGYRYWSFWERTGDRWTYATEGPGTARPADGTVQGFRFAVSEGASDASRPRGAASFGAICARTPAKSGTKRIALVIDFGTTSDAPSGETPPTPRWACARVPPTATTAEALATVAKPLRYDTNALLCAIAGYPRTGCGEQVSTTKNPSHKDSGPSVGIYAGAAAVATLAAAAVWQARRRRRND
ncbi:SCO2322 family protein [Streptomyces sp. NBC_00582]|uniref:SCO2322 family protein n=1 Tax=Streptomyces sp. NBC_00582 TaxID=2975783 RepID=UPI002E8027BB|nr:SCO2322 family protein [Streptomyces sp. NBC_00582]WUB65059.1 SCO2322 family protein [Streptomyces sp. NBC_00582]